MMVRPSTSLRLICVAQSYFSQCHGHLSGICMLELLPLQDYLLFWVLPFFGAVLFFDLLGCPGQNPLDSPVEASGGDVYLHDVRNVSHSSIPIWENRQVCYNIYIYIYIHTCIYADWSGRLLKGAQKRPQKTKTKRLSNINKINDAQGPQNNHQIIFGPHADLMRTSR